MRIDLYTLIHKAQRHHMCHLSAAIGKADFSDAGEAKSVYEDVRAIIAHLRDHAHNEETYIHPLFHQLGKVAGALEAGHVELETEFAGIEQLLEAGSGDALHQAYTRLLAAYFIHLDEEETAQRTVLWPNYTDEELAQTFNRFKAERDPAAARADLEFMLPALSAPELARLFRGIKATAPTAAFEGACALASKTLDSTAWDRLAASIA
jgi:hypothetical protein